MTTVVSRRARGPRPRGPALSLAPCTGPASQKMDHLVPALGAELPLLEDTEGGSRAPGSASENSVCQGEGLGGQAVSGGAGVFSV